MGESSGLSVPCLPPSCRVVAPIRSSPEGICIVDVSFSLHQVVIVLVAIGLEVEVSRHFGQLLITDAFEEDMGGLSN
jgi:hypothetical protein